MATFLDALDDRLTRFIRKQPMFFIATAPTRGRLNLSPKGMDSFRCIDEHTVAYADWTGSGNETAAHLDENGRVTIMFCSFGSKPLILRLYGKGRIIRPKQRHFKRWLAHFDDVDDLGGLRQIVVVKIRSVQTSCGYGVPRMDFKAERRTLAKWAKKKGPDGVKAYQDKNNRRSIDGKKIELPS